MKHQVPESLKFKRLCRRLNVSPVVAAGTLELLWITTQKNAPRGDVGRYSDEDLAIEVFWEGDPAELVEALVTTGWLDRDSEHRLLVHDWHEHAPRWVKGVVARTGGFLTKAETCEADVGRERTSATYDGDVREEQPNETKPNETKPNADDACASSCSEPASPPSDPPPDDLVEMEFPVSGSTKRPVWPLRASKVAEYRESFPGVNVDAELLKARQWCRDNVQHRKTARGMPAFLSRWLSKAQDRSSAARGSPPDRPPRRDVSDDELREILNAR